jgi:DNA-binding GntR family transcriptional regulator
LGTANIAFHQALVAIAGSPRFDELMRGLLAELRLVFHVMDDPRWFHKPYLARNQEILDVLTVGDGPRAAPARSRCRPAASPCCSSPTTP